MVVRGLLNYNKSSLSFNMHAFLKVIAACGSDEKCEVAKTRGAAHTINYNKESIRTRTKEITGGDGADIIVDMVGGNVWNECTRRLFSLQSCYC